MLAEELETMRTEIKVMTALYSKIADLGFRRSWWMSLPVPGLFRSIDFGKLYQKLERLNSAFEQKKAENDRIAEHLLMGDEMDLAIAYSEKCAALILCVKRLRTLYYGLYQKSLGHQGSVYEYSQYLSDLRAYKESHLKFLELSEKVELFHTRVQSGGR